MQSALTRALTGRKSGVGDSTTDGSSHSGSSAGNLKTVPKSAFPCLYQDGSEHEEQDDTVASEIEADVSSYRRSMDTPRRASTYAQRGSLDEGRRWLKLGSPSLAASFMGSTVGSLPPGMSPADRLSLSQSTPASPLVTNISSMPPERLRAATTEGRKLRRTLLKGSVVVIIVAGYEGKRFIYERMKELGIRLVVLDTKDSWAAALVKQGIVDRFVEADLSQNEHVWETCVDAITKVEQDLGQLDAIMSFWELSQPLVSRLCEHFSLPCNPPAAVDDARDKQRTRQKMRECGLPTPANCIIRRPEDLPNAAKQVGFPAVIKPTSGAASLGVIRVDNEPDLHRLYRQVCLECAAVTRGPDGGLQTRSVDSDAPLVEEESGAAYIAQTFIMEQYLDGPEVDVDVVVSQGEVVYGAVTDNWPTLEPYFNETGSNCPSNLPRQQQIELCELAVESVKAMGFQAGALHVELKYTSRNGPQLIEINARMGGGPVHMINKLVWGVDLIEEQCLASVGIPSRPVLAARPQVYLAENSINAKVTGVLEDDTYMQEWEGRDDVVYARSLVKAGEPVTCVADGLPTWVCEVMATKSSLAAAVDFVVQVEKVVDEKIRVTQSKSHVQNSH